jgi:hypothetical protein
MGEVNWLDPGGKLNPPFIPQDSGIIDEDGDSTERVDSALDDCSSVGGRRGVGHCLPAR